MTGGEEIPGTSAARVNESRAEARFNGDDVGAILRERAWMGAAADEAPTELQQWLDRAAMLLGPKVVDREGLASLLEAVFHYDAREILDSSEAHVVLARTGARTVIRELGREVIGGRDVDSDRLKEIFDRVKESTGYRGRELFHPLRLALAGRAGQGELDRVILLVDNAARLPFAVKVKSAQERMLEFCGQLD